MSEIDELRKQKKEIEDKIKQLKNKEEKYGNVKLSLETYPGYIKNKWVVSVKVCETSNNGQYREYWRAIIKALSKDEAVKQIPDIIKDLEKLHDSYITAQGVANNGQEPKTD